MERPVPSLFPEGKEEVEKIVELLHYAYESYGGTNYPENLETAFLNFAIPPLELDHPSIKVYKNFL